MSGFSSRIPPVKVIVDKELYNKLVYSLTMDEETGGEVNEKIKKLKDKLLTYSVPHIDEDGTIEVDVRFYVNEAEIIIKELLMILEDNIQCDVDYYSVLEKVRSSRQNNNEQ